MQQYTSVWFRARLGRLNGSEVGNIMGKGRAKDALFSQAGYTYLDKVVGETLMLKVCTTEEVDAYIEQQQTSSRATDYGHVQEPDALAAYAIETGRKIEEAGSTPYKDTLLSSSPDGITTDGGCVEVKSPFTLASSLKLSRASNLDELKGIEPLYAWQVVAECLCAGAEWCDLIVYDPRLKMTHIARMTPTEDDKRELLDKVAMATGYINTMVEGWRC